MRRVTRSHSPESVRPEYHAQRPPPPYRRYSPRRGRRSIPRRTSPPRRMSPRRPSSPPRMTRPPSPRRQPEGPPSTPVTEAGAGVNQQHLNEALLQDWMAAQYMLEHPKQCCHATSFRLQQQQAARMSSTTTTSIIRPLVSETVSQSGPQPTNAPDDTRRLPPASSLGLQRRYRHVERIWWLQRCNNQDSTFSTGGENRQPAVRTNDAAGGVSRHVVTRPRTRIVPGRIRVTDVPYLAKAYHAPIGATLDDYMADVKEQAMALCYARRFLTVAMEMDDAVAAQLTAEDHLNVVGAILMRRALDGQLFVLETFLRAPGQIRYSEQGLPSMTISVGMRKKQYVCFQAPLDKPTNDEDRTSSSSSSSSFSDHLSLPDSNCS